MPAKISFTQEEDNWLKQYYVSHTFRETNVAFNQKFRHISSQPLCKHCTELGLGKVFTKEMDEWLIENYPKANKHNDILGRFNKKFHTNKDLKSLADHASRTLKITGNYRYTKEELNWIKENYNREESLKEIYKDFCSTFGNIRTFFSFKGTAKRLGITYKERPYFKKGNINYKQKKKNELGIPKDIVMSDLKNGKYLLMDKKIHKKLCRKGNLGLGEITETLYDIELVKKEIGELSSENRRRD